MHISLSQTDLISYVNALVNSAFPDSRSADTGRAVSLALERVEYCFSKIALPHYSRHNEPMLDHLHGDQFATFLYFVSAAAYRDLNDDELAKKLCLLNRMRSALLIMYDTQLPDIFLIPHTVGTVIGKASYGDYTVFCQNVTIANEPSSQLSVGKGVVFFPGAFVTGTGTIGDFSAIAANSTVLFQDIPANHIVTGRSPDLQIRPRKRDFLARYFYRKDYEVA